MRKLIGFFFLFHACYSLYEYRVFKSHLNIFEYSLPLDIILEMIIGVAINLYIGATDYCKFEKIREANKSHRPEASFARPNFRDYNSTRGKALYSILKKESENVKF
mmetsp:Transcript_23414/g.27136  ORF Transcript_23414/g.27136 Transcript_23414/m.27136 type:complete len:106 (+) Transcript_23414:30-347(+)